MPGVQQGEDGIDCRATVVEKEIVKLQGDKRTLGYRARGATQHVEIRAFHIDLEKMHRHSRVKVVIESHGWYLEMAFAHNAIATVHVDFLPSSRRAQGNGPYKDVAELSCRFAFKVSTLAGIGS